MEKGSYYIYEILENGIIKRASLVDFKTKEEAEKRIKNYIHPLDRKKLFAVKVNY